MKLTWNLADKVLAELPSGAGQLDLHHTRPKIEGRDHGRTVFTLTPVSLQVHVPENNQADLHDLTGAEAAGSFLELTYADGRRSKIHTGIHTDQIAALLQGLLEPEDPMLASLSLKAEAGDIKAMEQIAEIYEHREDDEKADIWREKAAQSRKNEHNRMHMKKADRKHEEALRQAGRDYQEKRDSDVPESLSANDLWLASRGFAEVNDRSNEWKYLQRAAELSHPEAHYQMGAYLASGMHETEKDEQEAFRHMKEAADLGSTQAPYYLGSWYRNGVGTEKDLEQTDHWLAQDDSVKALIQRMLVKEELGDRQAALDLAKDAMAKTSSAKTRGMLQKKLDVWNEPSAEPAYLKAAGEYNAKEAVSAPKQVSARDLMNMAKGYADVNDFRQERRALEEAARLSHPEANYKLGAYLASGMHENETDPKAAFQWMMHAADLGNSQAPYYLGMWYAGGTGIEQDLEQAAFWLAKDESPKAKMQLALVLKQLEREEEAERTLQEILDAPEGQGTKAARDLAGRKLRQWRAEREKKQEQTQAQTRKSLRIAHVLNDAGEYDLAAEFLEQAAAGGSMEAKYLLALLLVKGQGVAADPERAKTLLEQTKDTRPESLYYLTYLESDPEKKEAYARAYLAGNPEKTRKAQVEKLLGIEEPET
ncbi:tetratricopeptide repeat protein, partial [Faecalibaculum rodentium]|uniref:tetratricopeptide repeat protein n=1 Tax=Faecalibaculum rodentium TaxID=1702221 RepID=UPI0026179FF8